MANKVTTIEEPDTTQLTTEVNSAVALSKKVKVTNPKQYETAAEYVQEIKDRTKKVKAFFEETKTLAQKLHKAIVAQEKLLLDPLADAEAIIKRAMSDYQMQVELDRRAAQKLIDDAAEKARLAAIKAAESGTKRDENRAAKLEAATVELANETEVPVVKASGTSSKVVFKFEITNEGLLPREFMVPNEAMIRKTVNAMGLAAMKTIPGIVVTEDIRIASRV
jgi:hypothetical protein